MENKPRGESINEIGETEGGGTLDGIPPHRFESPQPDQKTKQARQSPDLQKIRGGDDGIRTHDPHVANVMLSQLSYIPT